MSKVEIEHKLVRVISKIVVDGKEYPLTGNNIKVIEVYEDNGDDVVLERLSEYVLQF